MKLYKIESSLKPLNDEIIRSDDPAKYSAQAFSSNALIDTQSFS